MMPWNFQTFRLDLQCAIALAGLGACGQATPSAAPASDATQAAEVGCAIHQRRPAGGCCAAGQFWSATAAACTSAGPGACAAVLPDVPTSCQPTYCGDYLDAAGQPCAFDDPGCHLVGRACDTSGSASEKACPAGTWPTPAGCQPAGLTQQAAAAASGSDGAPDLQTPLGVPEDLPLVAADVQSFCWDAPSAAPTPCGADQASCPPGSMPDPEAPTACVPLAPLNPCPPGFVSNNGKTCLPDPADCGDPPFGAVAAQPGFYFVDPKAAGGGDGSVGAPFDSIAAAGPKTPAGSTLVLAAGVYTPFTLNVPLHVRGRCAALVTVGSQGSPASIRVTAGSQAEPVHLERLTLSGSGLGLVVDGKGHVNAKRLFVHQATAAGVLVSGKGNRLRLDESVVGATKDDGTDKGYGIEAVKGAAIELQNVAAFGNRVAGVAAVGAGSALTFNGLAVRDTKPGLAAGGLSGYGVLADGGTVQGRALRLHRNTTYALLVDHAGSADITGLVVTDTQPAPDGQFGNGVRVQGGSKATLRAARVSGNRGSGVAVLVGSSVLEMRGAVVDGTHAQLVDGSFGHGADVNYGGKLVVRGVRFSANVDYGILVAKGSSLQGAGLLVDGTLSAPKSKTDGVGLQIESQSEATMRSVRLAHNRLAGLRVIDAGTKAELRELLVDHTKAKEIDGGLGTGIVVGLGAQLLLQAARLHANLESGVVLVGANTRLQAAGLLIDAIVPKGQGLFTVAVASLNGAQLQLSGARMVHSAGVGVYASGGQTAQLHLMGLDMLGQPAPLLVFGVGVQVDGAIPSVQLIGCRLRQCRSVSLSVAGSDATIQDSAFLDTQVGYYQQYDRNSNQIGSPVQLSDGIVAINGAKIAVATTVVHGHARAGVLVNDASASLSASQFSGGIFGIAAVGKASSVQQTGVLLLGNQTAHSTDQGLVVPVPPKLVVVE